MAQAFKNLGEREILALAISLEEDDGRLFLDFAEAIQETYPSSAAVFREMAEQEVGHRRRLIEKYRERFGEHIPLIRREDVKGFVTRRPLWMMRPLGIEAVRKQAMLMEIETRRFYERAIKMTSDASTRALLAELADEERHHSAAAAAMEAKHLGTDERQREAATERRIFVLQIVQPGLAGLMDGSVSTLAPLFAAAFATHSTSDAFIVGIAASVGAGISMGFAEALSDDGALSGRGQPLLRGMVCGLMTTLGGLGHTLPYLIPDFFIASAIAIGIVICELGAIAYIRHRYMDTPWFQSTVQVVVGGVLVFIAGIIIGTS